MAQRVVTGLKGSIALPDNITAFLNSVTINGGQAIADISHFGGAGYHSRCALLHDFAGTAGGFLTCGVATSNIFALVDRDGGTMTIALSDEVSVSFHALIGNVQVNHRYDGVAVLSFDWAIDNDVAPTWTWATT